MSHILVLLCLNIYILESYCLTTASDAENRLDDYILGTTKLNLDERFKRVKRGANPITDCIYFNFHYGTDNYNICLHLNYMPPQELLNEKKSFIVTYLSENKTTNQSIVDMNINFAEGYVTTLQNSSAVRGYIHDDSFLGTIITDKYKYNIEPIFETDIKTHVLISRRLNKRSQKTIFPRSGTQEYSGRVCSLNLLLDYSFYSYVGKYDPKLAASIVLNSLDRVNSLFRSTDFNEDNVPDNIGFQVQNLIIVTSQVVNNQILPAFGIDPIDPEVYMAFLAVIDVRLRQCCMLVAFTTQAFHGRVIGLSFVPQENHPHAKHNVTGGICSFSALASNNLMLITYRQTSGHLLVQVLTDHSLAHEFGHSFGSRHDPANNVNCKGFVMGSQVRDIDKEYLTGFSPCSKKSINKILNKRSNCLIALNGEFCGNGILEAAEECDCGFFYHCLHFDHCCQPHSDPDQCTINRNEGYECHPMQGMCCKNDCTYEDLSSMGLDCKDYLYAGCKTNTSKCGFEGTCIKGHCHSNECVRIGLEECACNKNIAKHCQICCLYQNKCQAAVDVTKSLIQGNSTLIDSLRKFSAQSRPMDKVYKLCDSSNCLQMSFKHFDVSNYCLLFGTLGKCSQDFQCKTQFTVPVTLPEVINTHWRLNASKICNAVLLILFYVYAKLQ